jgi:diguanylate cyclase (GGDEF)-like protein
MLVLAIVFAATTAAALAVAVYYRGEAAKAADELDRMANYDRLTGLPNRKILSQWLNRSLKASRRNNARVGIFFVELWGFEHLNDTYGHEVGDALMQAASQDLRSASRPDDVVARYSGPQFVVASIDINDPSQARRRAEELLAAVQKPYEVGKDRIRLHASIGVALTDQTYSNADDVILDATVALADAMEEGKGTTRLFDHSLRSQMTPSNAEHRLREALDRGEFWLLYLPVMSLRDNQIVGVEALLRWADPERGLISPGTFLRALDETGLIVPVGTWVLREAARQSKAWQDAFPDRPDLQLTVNVSPRQIAQSDFLDTLSLALDESEVDNTRMCIEIAEASLAHDPETVWAILRQAKQLGCRLALDDFGAGYSSFSYLRHFKVDNLKIDRTFVTGVARSSEDQAIVQHMIGLAHALGMNPVAEGVETAEQAAELKRLGCDWAQGYYFANPQSADVITKLLSQGTFGEADRPEDVDVDEVESGATVVAPDLT